LDVLDDDIRQWKPHAAGVEHIATPQAIAKDLVRVMQGPLPSSFRQRWPGKYAGSVDLPWGVAL